MLPVLRNVLNSSCAVAVVISALPVPVSAMVTDDDKDRFVPAAPNSSAPLRAATKAPQVSSSTSTVAVAVQNSDIQFDGVLHFLRTGHLLAVEEIVSYLDQARIEALYNAEVAPDSSADYKRNAIRKRLKPLVIKKIEDRAIECVLPSADSNVTKKLLRAEVKSFLHSEILSRKADGERVNVCDLWMSGEVEDYFRAKAYIDEMPTGEREISLRKFKKLRRLPPCVHIENDLFSVSLGPLSPPAGLEKLPHMRILSIADSPMTSVKGFYKFQRLQNISIHRTPLVSLEGLSDTPNVDRIARIRWSPENPVKCIHWSLEDRISLMRSIHLHKTGITSLKGLERLVLLDRLSIQDCPLASLEGIELMSELSTVGLYDLPLKSLRGLEKLRKLNVAELHDLPNAEDKIEISRELIMKGCNVTLKMKGLDITPTPFNRLLEPSLNYVFTDF